MTNPASPGAATGASSPWPRRLARAVAAAVIVACFVYVFESMGRQWPAVRDGLRHIDWGGLAAAFALALVNFVLVSTAWNIAMRDRGERVDIVYSAQMARYVPGKLWMVFGQVYAARALGCSEKSTLTAGVMQWFGGACGSFFVFWISSLASGRYVVAGWAAFVAGVASSAVLVAAPTRLESLVNRYRRSKGKSPVSLTISPRAALAIIAVMTLAWAEHCLAFVVLSRAIAPFSTRSGFELALIYNLAYHLAFYAIIVPGGLGIREGTVTAMATSVIGAGPAALVALMQRFCFTIAELAAFAISMLVIGRAVRRSSTTPPDSGGASDRGRA
jgi:uncharacterized membrane protein YbhN (UPF0104 family)